MLIHLNKSEHVAFRELIKHNCLPASEAGVCVTPRYCPNGNGIHIFCNGEATIVEYSEPVYLFRGLGLIAEQDTNVFDLRETGRFTTNGIMIDCSRNAVLTIDTLKKVIRQMALMGMNMLMLYTEDTYEVAGESYFGYMRGKYTRQEIIGLVDYAGIFGIEVVPCIQTLGHLGAVLKWPAYREVRDTGDILLVDHEKTYALVEKMIAACREVFRTTRIHIGMDESNALGRGRYMDLHGADKPHEMMCRHMARVSEICRKYDFEPMIWSDTFFGCVGGYHSQTPLPADMKGHVPEDMSLVYWDYRTDDTAECERVMRNHLSLTERTIFAGAAWKFRGFVPALSVSMERTKIALNACGTCGIKQVFTTAWADCGAEASFFSALPVYQLQAELNFTSEVHEETLKRRLKTCTGAEYDDFMCIDVPELDPARNEGAVNPHRYLLYQDVLMGLYDYHVPAGMNAFCHQIAERIEMLPSRHGDYGYIFEALLSLYRILELKSEFGIRLKQAYETQDRVFIQDAVEHTIPSMIERVKAMRDCLEAQWMRENKVFGFEVQDIRFGGLVRRLMTAKNRIQDYLDGKIAKLEELEIDRLPMANTEEGVSTRCDSWSGTVTVAAL